MRAEECITSLESADTWLTDYTCADRSMRHKCKHNASACVRLLLYLACACCSVCGVVDSSSHSDSSFQQQAQAEAGTSQAMAWMASSPQLAQRPTKPHMFSWRRQRFQHAVAAVLVTETVPNLRMQRHDKL